MSIFKNTLLDDKTVADMAEEWYKSTTLKRCPEPGTPEWDQMYEDYLDYAFPELDTEAK